MEECCRILPHVVIEISKLFKKTAESSSAPRVELPPDKLQPVSRPPTPECAHPERWSAFDDLNPEIEVLDFLRTMVMTIKPGVVVQTGARNGVSCIWLAEGLKVNGEGTLLASEENDSLYALASRRIEASAVADWIKLSNRALFESDLNGPIDLLFLNSKAENREAELRQFCPKMNPNGVILMSESNSALGVVRNAALKLEREGLISVVLLPTPSGLVVSQKRDGRV